ncbi:MAG TPA: hypothetical protein VFZ21_27565, partial [Gemmatimonadaceae bacterium]|nr:hypothetical protein [Gemmatimonadaceae bacterium]
MYSSRSRLRFIAAALSLIPASAVVAAQARPTTGSTARSAAISNVRYEVTFDRTTAPARTLGVTMTFDVTGQGPVLLSLPGWTPGAYEISNYARWVS